jgi:hypothetical protein
MHEKHVCSCGEVLRRCRCIGPHTVVTVKDGCELCKRRPLPPESLVGAMHDTVHAPSSKGRPARSFRSRERG